jgi:natural product precursor
MKKQNLNNRLAFNKASITELNQEELNKVQGGTNFNPFATNPLSCTYCVASSNGPGTMTDFYETMNKPL